MIRFLRIFVPLALLASLGAMQNQPYYGPNGDGTLKHEDDLRWIVFNTAKVTADTARGEYRAAFTSKLEQMDGQWVDITGYMMPITAEARSSHFILTRRSGGCPFCPPNEPTEAIEIYSAQPATYTQRPVKVSGRLKLMGRSDRGLFYQFQQATVG